MHNRTHTQCLHRWQKVLNPGLVKGAWSSMEDDLLTKLVETHGPKNWTAIASHLNGRIGKQCRERWYNHLDPTIRKDPWTPEEDRRIVELHAQLGNRWAEIAKVLVGRWTSLEVILIVIDLPMQLRIIGIQRWSAKWCKSKEYHTRTRPNIVERTLKMKKRKKTSLMIWQTMKAILQLLQVHQDEEERERKEHGGRLH